MKQVFSLSELLCFEYCQKFYENIYINKLPQKISNKMSFGTCLHKTLHLFYLKIQKNQTETPMFEEDKINISLDLLLNIYEQSWVSSGYVNTEQEVEYKKKGKNILINFYNKWKEKLGNPLYLEKSFKLELNKYYITGRFDRIDIINRENPQNVKIIDYKSGRTKTQDEVSSDLQLALYSIAAKKCFQLNVNQASLYYINENIEINAKFQPDMYNKTTDRTLNIINKIHAGEFQKTQNINKCKSCSFQTNCEIKNK